MLPIRGRRRTSASALALVLACTPVVAGCGKPGLSTAPSDQQQVSSTLQRFAHAVAVRDYATVCTQLLAPSLTERLAQIGLPCAQGLARGFGLAQSPTLTVRTVTVTGARADAVVHSTAANQPASDDTVGLIKSAGRWRIAALGPAPTKSGG